MNDTQLFNYENLLLQAAMFDMIVDWESLELVPRKRLRRKEGWLERWIEGNQDKQFDHEVMNRDGDK